MNRRAVVFWGGLVVLLLLVGLISGGRTQSGDPLDPDSTDPLGTRGLVLFLEEYDTEIVRGFPDGQTTRTLLLADQLTPEQRTDLEVWVEDGGILIVTDPGSEFSPQGFPAVDSSGSLSSGSCTVAGLTGLTLEAGSFILYADEDEQGQPNGGAGSCFGDGFESYVQVTDVGAGRVIALGGALALTNENLDAADNAVLAARLLLDEGASTAGTETRIAVLYDEVFTSGSRSLGDLVPQAAKWATWQLLVAFGIYVLWKAPRFGRPVTEPQPVELPGSLLVRATGELHRRSGGHAEASHTLRSHVERRLRKQLRVSPELPTPELVQTAAEGHDLDGTVIDRALNGRSASNGQDLAVLLTDIDQVNTIVLSEPTNDQRPAGEST